MSLNQRWPPPAWPLMRSQRAVGAVGILVLDRESPDTWALHAAPSTTALYSAAVDG